VDAGYPPKELCIAIDCRASKELSSHSLHNTRVAWSYRNAEFFPHVREAQGEPAI